MSPQHKFSDAKICVVVFFFTFEGVRWHPVSPNIVLFFVSWVQRAQTDILFESWGPRRSKLVFLSATQILTYETLRCGCFTNTNLHL